MKENLTYFELSRYWFDFCNNNSDIIKPIHVALYFYILDLNNKLNNPQSIKIPKEFAMQAIGVSNWRTYSNALKNIIDWGFISISSKAKNQNSATVIAVVKNTVAIKVCSCKKYSSEYSSIVDVINSISTNVSILLKTYKTYKLSETREREGGVICQNEEKVEESIIELLLKERIWIESVQRKFKLTSDEIPIKLDEFIREMTLRGEESSIQKISDAKRRFFFWMSKPKDTKEPIKSKKDKMQDLIQSSLDECNKL